MPWSAITYQLFGYGTPQSCRIDLLDSSKDKLRFVVISDTHNLHEEIHIPDGDVLVHAGDFTNHGSLLEVQRFTNWFKSMPHPVKLLVPGNHDMILDKEYYSEYWGDWSYIKEDCEGSIADSLSGIWLLVDSGVEVDGVRVWGSPWVPRYAAWRTAFNRDPCRLHPPNTPCRPDCIGPARAAIPGGVDVLVTHAPPLGVLDREPDGRAGGCAELRQHVRERVRPRFHLFGHVHSDHGVFEDAGTVYINPAAVSDLYTARPDSAIAFDFPVRCETRTNNLNLTSPQNFAFDLPDGHPASLPGPRRIPFVQPWVPAAGDWPGRSAGGSEEPAACAI